MVALLTYHNGERLSQNDVSLCMFSLRKKLSNSSQFPPELSSKLFDFFLLGQLLRMEVRFGSLIIQ